MLLSTGPSHLHKSFSSVPKPFSADVFLHVHIRVIAPGCCWCLQLMQCLLRCSKAAADSSAIAFSLPTCCRFGFPAIKPPEPFTVSKTSTLQETVDDAEAAQVYRSPWCCGLPRIPHCKLRTVAMSPQLKGRWHLQALSS